MCHTGTGVTSTRHAAIVVAVGAPPVAPVAAHLLGGDEVGAAPRHVRVVVADELRPMIRRARRCGAWRRTRTRCVGRRVGSGVEHRARRRAVRGPRRLTRPAAKSRPASANAATVTSRSVANAGDAGRALAGALASGALCGRQVGRQSPASSSSSGSATRCSSPVSMSTTQRQFTGSLPPRLRANTRRRPSGLTTRSRGSPRLSRWVRAYCRGNVSVDDAVSVAGVSASGTPEP